MNIMPSEACKKARARAKEVCAIATAKNIRARNLARICKRWGVLATVAQANANILNTLQKNAWAIAKATCKALGPLNPLCVLAKRVAREAEKNAKDAQKTANKIKKLRKRACTDASKARFQALIYSRSCRRARRAAKNICK